MVVLLFLRQRPEDSGLPAVVSEEEIAGQKIGPAVHETDRDRFSFFSQLTNPVVITMGLAYFCFKFLRYAVNSWLAYFLAVVYGLQKAQAGYASTVFDWGCMAGCLFAGIASDRLFRGMRSAVMLLMSVLMAAAFLGIFQFGNRSVVLLLVLYGLVGFALSGPDTLLVGAGASDVGTKRGAVATAGIVNGIASLGPVVQEQVVPRLYRSGGEGLSGIGQVNLLMLGVAIAGTLILLFLWRQGKKRPERAV